MTPAGDCERIDELLSGYLDGELTQGDRQRVELHLERCARCRAAFDELAELRGAVNRLSFGSMPAERWSEIMNDLPTKTSRGAGWLLYVGGLLLVCGYGLYQFAVDDTVPALVKTGVGALLVGFLLLLFSVLRERLAARKTDKYKDVQI